jgi:flagellar hook-associated protein 2
MATPMFNIGGLSSGLDTNSIVTQLMAIEKQPITALQTKQATSQAKANAWKQIGTALSSLTSRINDLSLPGKLDSLTQASSSNTSAVTVSASTGVSPVNLSFTVDQLAQSEQRASTTNFGGTNALVGAGTFTFSTGNDPAQTITTTASTTLSDLAQQINTMNKGVAASIVSTDGTSYKLVLRSQTSGQANTLNVGGSLTGLQASDFNVVQAAKDAKLTIGSGVGALTVTRGTNTITDLAPGLTVNLLTTTSDPITVTAGRSPDAVVKMLQGLVTDFNNVVSTTKDLGKIDPADSSKNGILAGDATLLSVTSRLSGLIGQAVSGLGGPLSYANGAGLSIQRDGTLSLDETKLRAALASDWNGVTRLFSRSGAPTDNRVQFVNGTGTTAVGSYGVQITRAATQATVTGGAYVPPVADTALTILSSGKSANVTIAAGATLDQAVAALNDALDAQGLTSLRASNASGALKLAETRYGPAANFTVTGGAAFGIDGSQTAFDVAGTINGKAATGNGRLLTSTDGDSSGLQLVVTASAGEVATAGGTLGLGTVAVTQGWAGAMSSFLNAVQGSTGLVGLAKSRLDADIADATTRIADLNTRMDAKEQALRAQFTAMEQAVANMKQWSGQLGLTTTS